LNHWLLAEPAGVWLNDAYGDAITPKPIGANSI